MGYCKDVSLANAFEKAATTKVNELSAAHICMLTWAFVEMGYPPNEDFLEAATRTIAK